MGAKSTGYVTDTGQLNMKPLAFEPILTAEAMREADRRTIEHFGIPAFTLMEVAGRTAVAELKKHIHLSPDMHVVCLCGKGNNGGDGYVIARVLANQGIKTTVVSAAPENELTEDAARNYRLLLEMVQHDPFSQLHLTQFAFESQLDTLPEPDVIIDALLGTGIKSTLRPPYSYLVHWANTKPAFTLAVDIPSGLHADNGKVLGEAVQADLTVSMGAHKTGLFLGEGYAYSGDKVATEIGIPRYLIHDASSMEGCALVPTFDEIRNLLPQRSLFAHKYSVGMTLIVAGAPGLTGAATLASQAAEQSGTGAVVCASPQEIQPILAGKMTEVMTLGIPGTKNGIDAQKALDLLAPRLQKASALLIGCGMGQLPDTQSFIRALATSGTGCPIILDADGLNAFQGHTHLFEEHAEGKWILTPHLGEFKRLTGEDVDLQNRIHTVKKYATSWNCVLILKGVPGLVGTPDGSVYINPGVNNALATAGTGDVLAGLCAGLLSQGLSPKHAALCAMHIGIQAANSYSDQFHPSTMRASDLITHIRTVLTDRYS